MRFPFCSVSRPTKWEFHFIALFQMEGWIKLYRAIVEWEWFSDSHTLSVFIYLLATANHAENKWRGIEIKRGQCITSQDTIARATGLSRQQVRTALEHLTLTEEIKIESTKQFSMVTISNYESYQMETIKEQPTNNQAITNEQPSDNHKQECKNDKNEKKEGNNILVPKFSFEGYLLENGVPENVVKDFMKVRKDKRASNTESAMKGILREVQKAGITLAEAIQICAERSWQGFKAEWYAKDRGEDDARKRQLAEIEAQKREMDKVKAEQEQREQEQRDREYRERINSLTGLPL